MKGLLITILILVILGMIKVGVHVLYQQKNVRLEVLISKFKIVVLGQEKKKKRAKPSKPPKEKNVKPKKEKSVSKKQQPVDNTLEKTAQKKPREKGKFKPWIDAALTYWQDILQLIGRVLKSPTLDDLQLEIHVGGGDAEKCAMTYGRICAIVGGVLPVVENIFGIRKRRIVVYPCFDRDDLEIMADVSITLRVYEIFALVFALLGLGLKIFLEARKNKKGGAAV